MTCGPGVLSFSGRLSCLQLGRCLLFIESKDMIESVLSVAGCSHDSSSTRSFIVTSMPVGLSVRSPVLCQNSWTDPTSFYRRDFGLHYFKKNRVSSKMRYLPLRLPLPKVGTYYFATARQNRSNGFWDHIFFKMATAAVLDFKQCNILLADGVQRSAVPHSDKFPQNGPVYCRHRAIFIFLNEGRHHLEYVKFSTFIGWQAPGGGAWCFIMPNFVKIRQTDISQFFDFSRWRPSAILDFFVAYFDHHEGYTWWSLSLCKIWLQSMQ